jgi:hypothetical protein
MFRVDGPLTDLSKHSITIDPSAFPKNEVVVPAPKAKKSAPAAAAATTIPSPTTPELQPSMKPKKRPVDLVDTEGTAEPEKKKRRLTDAQKEARNNKIALKKALKEAVDAEEELMVAAAAQT